MVKTIEKQILAFLKEHPLATIATISPEGAPHTATVYTYVDPEFNCYCLTKSTTRKYTNARDRILTTLSFADESKLLACQIYGNADVLEWNENTVAAISQLQEIIATRQGKGVRPPVAQLHGGQYCIIKVLPHHIEFSDYYRSAHKKRDPKRVSLKVS